MRENCVPNPVFKSYMNIVLISAWAFYANRVVGDVTRNGSS